MLVVFPIGFLIVCISLIRLFIHKMKGELKYNVLFVKQTVYQFSHEMGNDRFFSEFAATAFARHFVCVIFQR